MVMLSTQSKTNNTLIAKRNYTFDAVGRVATRTQTRGTDTARNDSFGYNDRSELTSATLGTDQYGYSFDNIGNRITAAELADEIAYLANNLNQYTSIEKNSGMPFVPTFDDDGNQLTVQTATGVWNVTYNAENRPITFTNGTTIIECTYDSLGRRFEKKVTEDGSITKMAAFCLSRLSPDRGVRRHIRNHRRRRTPGHSLATTTFWDPMEPTATRPLAITDHTDNTPLTYFHTHDLTKNVCELLNTTGTIITTYDYTPFGSVIASNTTTPNTFMFSSEVFDPETALVYYNFRHYNPTDGRWVNRDPIGENGGWNLYRMLINNLTNTYDQKGLDWWNPFSWDWGEIGSEIIKVIDDSANAVASGGICAIKYTVKITIYMPTSYLFGRNMGEFWRSTLWEEWGRGPTGGFMPQKLTNDLWDVRGQIPENAGANGMHAWHAASNAYLVQEMGMIGIPIIFVGGVIHETPLDYASFCAEERDQGTVNHMLDSITDIIANIVGITLGGIGLTPGITGEIGNWIPGPGEPDPRFNNNPPPPYGTEPKPSNAWGYGPSNQK